MLTHYRASVNATNSYNEIFLLSAATRLTFFTCFGDNYTEKNLILLENFTIPYLSHHMYPYSYGKKLLGSSQQYLTSLNPQQ